MKTPLTILFAGTSIPHAFDAAFDGLSAFDRALLWAETVPASVQTVIFTDDDNCAAVEKLVAGRKNISLVRHTAWTNALVAKEIAATCSSHKADYAAFAWVDLPFLSSTLTSELIETHTKYLAEYTFADGYPYGLAPEIVDGGAAGIIAALGEGVQKSAGEKPVSRDALFSIMSGDINSFEIETVIAPKDYRMLRLDFSCGEKANFLACQNVFSAAQGKVNLQSSDFDVIALSDLAESDASVLQTVPAFYNVQISGRYQHNLTYSPYQQMAEKKTFPDMAFSDFKKLVAQMAAYSEKAVVSLSAFGEPLLHPQFADCVAEVLSYPGLSVFVESDGTLVTEAFVSALAEKIRPLGTNRVIWCVLLDAMESNLYAQIHGCAEAEFSKAVDAVGLLAKAFPHQVYPQMTRMKKNEVQLEPFYRYWKNKDNPSFGELIIQKFNTFCGSLPDQKSADLSPLVRNPCWHLRRDMTILSDGTVPLCLCQCLSDQTIGNVLKEPVATVWERMKEPLALHLKKDYPALCKACDEFYTFNF